MGDVLTWGKMNANVPHMAAPRTFWDPFRSAMESAVGDIMHVGKLALPVVVYLERVSPPPPN